MANSTVSLNIKVKPRTKAQLAALADEFGMTTTALVTSMINQVIRTGRLRLDAYGDGEPSDELLTMVKASKADIAAGRVTKAFSGQSAVDYLKSRAGHAD